MRWLIVVCSINRNLSFSQHPLAVFQRGMSGDFPELIAKIGLGCKTAAGGDLAHGEVGGDQRRLGGGDPETEQPLGGGLSVSSGVEPVEVIGVEAKLLCQRLQRDGLLIMFPQVLVSHLQILFVQ